MLHPITQTAEFITTLEQFVVKAEAFLQNHYEGATCEEDVEKICNAINCLWLDTDKKELLKEAASNELNEETTRAAA